VTFKAPHFESSASTGSITWARAGINDTDAPTKTRRTASQCLS
jgi:hypothetical protein